MVYSVWVRTTLGHVAAQRSTPGRRRAAALSLRATDLDWQWGTGPEVAGPGEDLLLAIAGRSVALARLAEPGARILAGRQG